MLHALNDGSFKRPAPSPSPRGSAGGMRLNGTVGQAGDKHRRILQAAVKVFARHGFHHSRISEIARAAGVADGTIYLYFHGKDDLLLSLLEEEMQALLERMRAELAGESDPARKLERFARLHLHAMAEKRELAEVLQVEVRQAAKFMKGYRDRRFAQYLGLLGAIIREGQEAGLFDRAAPSGLLARAFFGALDETSRGWAPAPDEEGSPETAARQISWFFLRGVLARPAAPPAPGEDSR